MRVYATPEQLATWPGGDTIPAGQVTTALRLASQVVDRLLTGYRYDTDTNGLPSDPDAAQAMADATCAIAVSGQAAGVLEPDSAQEWSAVSIGAVSLSGRVTAAGAVVIDGIPVPAQALLALRSVGTLSVSTR